MDNLSDIVEILFLILCDSYPRSLEHHCTTICEPVIHGYYDWSIAKGIKGEAGYAFSALVAKRVDEWLGPNNDQAKGEELYEYFVSDARAGATDHDEQEQKL